MVKDATGFGKLVFSSSPEITLSKATGLPLETGVVGNLPVENLDYGRDATASAVWHGDGKWRVPVKKGQILFFLEDVEVGEDYIALDGTDSSLPNLEEVVPKGVKAHCYLPKDGG